MTWEEFKKNVTLLQKNDKIEISPPKTHFVLQRTSYEPALSFHRVLLYTLHDLKHVRPTRVLDLHGYRTEPAKIALENFLHDSSGWVLVITGKGNPTSLWTLRRLVPLWLNELPIKGYGPAPKDLGGEGALCVNLSG